MSTQGSLSTGDLFSLKFPWPSNHFTGYMNFDLILFAVFNKQYNFKSNTPNNFILIGGFVNLIFINCLSYPRYWKIQNILNKFTIENLVYNQTFKYLYMTKLLIYLKEFS